VRAAGRDPGPSSAAPQSTYPIHYQGTWWATASRETIVRMNKLVVLALLTLTLGASAADGRDLARHPIAGTYTLVTRIVKPNRIVANGTLIIDSYKASTGAINGHGSSQGYPLSMIGAVKGDAIAMTVVNPFGIAHDTGTIWPDGSMTGTILVKTPSTTERGTWEMTPKAGIAPTVVALTVGVKGTGSIILNTGAKVRCGARAPNTCSKEFDVKKGTTVSLTPVGVDGSKFTAWAGDCKVARTCVVTVKRPMRAIATFADPGTRANPIRLGSEGWVDDDQNWSLKVDSVVPDATAQVLSVGHNTPPRPGAQDFLITVSATSHNTDLDLSALIVNLYAKTGNSFSTYGTYSIKDASCGTLPPPHLWDQATLIGDPATWVVADGQTVTGTICFQVDSDDAKTLQLFTEAPFQYPDGLDDPPTPDAHAHWFALH
jgi:hypothetical protein